MQSHTAASLMCCPIHWPCCCCCCVHRNVCQIDCCAKQSDLQYMAKSPLPLVAHKLYKLVFPDWNGPTCGVPCLEHLHNKHLADRMAWTSTVTNFGSIDGLANKLLITCPKNSGCLSKSPLGTCPPKFTTPSVLNIQLIIMDHGLPLSEFGFMQTSISCGHR